MNGNGNGHLQKHYGVLTVRERVAAIFDALARSDQSELLALAHSAPREKFTRPAHAWLVDAILFAAHQYRMAQLDTAANVLLFSCFDWSQKIGNVSEGEAFDAALVGLYTFQTRAAAWATVCAENGITPDVFDNALHLPGTLILDMTARIAAEMEPQPDEIEELVRARGGNPITVEGEAAYLRKQIAAYAEGV